MKTNILNYRVIIEQDEDGVFVASVPSVQGCHSQGDTYEEALENIKDVLELCLEVAKETPNYNTSNDYTMPHFIGITDIAVQI